MTSFRVENKSPVVPVSELQNVMKYLTKNMRVRAQWLQVYTHPYSLAGAQAKVQAQAREVTGVVTHIRANAPINWTGVHVWILPDSGGDEIELDISSVVEVL